MSHASPLPTLTRLARAVGLLAFEAASTGLAVAGVLSRDVLGAYGHRNELGTEQREHFLACMGGAALFAIVGSLAYVRRSEARVEFVERLARRLSPLAVVGLVPFLLDRRVWDGWDLVVLPLVLGFSWGLSAAVRTVLDTEPAFPSLRRRRDAWLARLAGVRVGARVRAALLTKRAPLALVTLGAAAYGTYFSVVTIVHHENLGTRSFDLGLEDNLMWHVVHGGLPLFRSTPFAPNGTHFGNHATFFAYVIAPLYWLAPRPETLLVVQAVMMGAAVVPLYLYASRHLPPWTAALVAFAYLAYPPLHGANLYDFHYLPLGVLFLWLALYAIEAKRPLLATASIVLALSVREDVAACLAVVGLFLLLRGVAPRAGALVAAVGAAYFLVLKLGVMPLFSSGDASFLNQYSGLLPQGEHSFGGVLKTVLANPAFTADVILTRDKVTYLLEVFAPLLLLPLLRPIGLLLVVPGVLFTLLATDYAPLYTPTFQYTSYWTAFVFVGVVVTLEHAGRARYDGDRGGPTRRTALVAGLLAASLLCTYLDGAILHRYNVRGGFWHFDLATSAADLENRKNLAALLAQIPPDAKVAASERLVPHVSSRSNAYSLRQGTFDADWLLFEEPPRTDERDKALAVLIDGTFGVVDDRVAMVLAKRGEPTTNNAAVIRRR